LDVGAQTKGSDNINRSIAVVHSTLADGDGGHCRGAKGDGKVSANKGEDQTKKEEAEKKRKGMDEMGPVKGQTHGGTIP